MLTQQIRYFAGIFVCKIVFLIVLVGLVRTPALAQVSVYATGLVSPIGVDVDARGWVWVADQGSGNNDGQISIVTPDMQVHPFISGLPSEVVPAGDILGPTHTIFDVNGNLLILQGEGANALSRSILRFDTTGFTPGDPPLGLGDTLEVYDIGRFVFSQGFVESNTYNLSLGPNDDYFIVDAAANAIIRRERSSGAMSVFATFDPIPNPTPVGPPVIDAVPTAAVFTASRFYVSALTGFPFLDNLAQVYQVNLNGDVSTFRDGLTLLTDIDIDPRDNRLTVLQFGRFDLAGGFLPASGAVIKLLNSGADTLAVGLNFVSGMRFAANGDLFVSSLFGEILKITSTPTGVESPSAPLSPQSFVLRQNYPNPFNPETRIAYEIGKSGQVTIKIFNVLGQEMRTLVDEVKSAGAFEVIWDGWDNTGQRVPGGLYFYRMETHGHKVTRKMTLLQ
jgi:hypothetical protein